MKEIGILDEVQIRADVRKMLKDIGMSGGIQTLYELIRFAEILSEVLVEEQKK